MHKLNSYVSLLLYFRDNYIIFRHIKSVLHFFKKNPEGFIMLPFAVKFTYNIK